MAITDYIPNVFGSAAPTTYEGLLGMGLITPQQLEQTQKTANIQGLLGAGLALAQGMSKIGPRRSAAENILGALAGGFGAAGGAYQQGLQNIVQQQQLSKAVIEQKQLQNRLAAVQQAKQQYPDLAPLADIDPAKFAEEVALRERMKGFAPKGGQETPESLRAKAQSAYMLGTQYKPYGDALMEQADRLEAGIGVSAAPQVTPPAQVTTVPQVTTAPQAAPATEAVPTIQPQEKSLEPMTFTEKRVDLQSLLEKKAAIQAEIDRNSDPRLAGNKVATGIVDRGFERLKAIDKEISKASVADLSGNLTSFMNSAPPQFKPAIQELINTAAKGEITGDQYSNRVAELQKQVNEFNKNELEFKRKQADFSNEARRIAKSKFKKNIEDLTPEEAGQLEAIMKDKEKELRIAGRTIVTQSVYAEKELTKGRAGATVKAEEAAFNAMNTASDVRAIVDILKPYQGGKIDEFKASLGSYLPNTSLAQIATANDLATAIKNRIAPTLRVEGSGATSDFETRSYLNALPSLIQYPAGRELMAVYAERLADRAAKSADLRAEMVQDGTFSLQRFREKMKERGFDRVFTDAELAQLRGGTTTEGLSKEGQKAYDKYKK